MKTLFTLLLSLIFVTATLGQGFYPYHVEESSSDPTASENSSNGFYTKYQLWRNTSSDQLFFCWDDDDGTWKEVYSPYSTDITLNELSSDPSDPSEGAFTIWMGDGTGSGSDGDILVKKQAGGTVDQQMLSNMVAKKYTIDCSVTHTAEETAIVTLPADTILHNIIAYTVVAMNGDATTTLEVGLSTNADKYIDSVDYDESTDDTFASMLNSGNADQAQAEYLSSSTDIVVTSTNTASATEGEIDVFIIYSNATIYNENAITVVDSS